jgi:hypothetical protein
VNHRKPVDPVSVSSELLAWGDDGQVYPIRLDYAAKVVVAGFGTVSISSTLRVDSARLRGNGSGIVLDNIITVLQWGYAVRALPRKRGPGGKEVSRDLFNG